MTLGQEFSGYQSIVENSLSQINQTKKLLSKLAQGGTAVGTGINTHKKFGLLIAKEISSFSKIKFSKTNNHFEAQSSQNSAVAFSGSLKTLAIGLNKIAKAFEERAIKLFTSGLLIISCIQIKDPKEKPETQH